MKYVFDSKGNVPIGPRNAEKTNIRIGTATNIAIETTVTTLIGSCVDRNEKLLPVLVFLSFWLLIIPFLNIRLMHFRLSKLSIEYTKDVFSLKLLDGRSVLVYQVGA